MHGGVLAVAEGIETALAYAALTGTPTWAALSSAGMSRLEPPDGLRWLVVAAGIDVRIDLPSRHRTDWADVLAASCL